MIQTIDINCDLGEGIGNDSQLMPFLSSCNIACGGHFGDEQTIAETVQLAKQYHVKIGAHPSFPDQANFGRKIMEIEDEVLIESIHDQILLVDSISQAHQLPMHHVKLHGALYNLAAINRKTTDLVIKACLKTKLDFKIYAPYGSVLSELGKNYFEIVHEAFIDRAYNDGLSLVSRANDKALITDPAQAWVQLNQIFSHHEVKSITGQISPIQADTFCIHGDTEAAPGILAFIQEKLNQRGISIKTNDD